MAKHSPREQVTTFTSKQLSFQLCSLWEALENAIPSYSIPLHT